MKTKNTMKKENKKEIKMNKRFGIMLIASLLFFSGSISAVDYDVIPDEIEVTEAEYEQLAEALGFKSYHKMGNKAGKKAINPGKGDVPTKPYKKGKKVIKFSKKQKYVLLKTFGYKGVKSLKGTKKKVKLSKKQKHVIAKALGYKDVSSIKGDKKAKKYSKAQKKMIAKAFGFKAAASLKGPKKLKKMSKSDKKQLAKAFGYKGVASLKGDG